MGGGRICIRVTVAQVRERYTYKRTSRYFGLVSITYGTRTHYPYVSSAPVAGADPDGSGDDGRESPTHLEKYKVQSMKHKAYGANRRHTSKRRNIQSTSIRRESPIHLELVVGESGERISTLGGRTRAEVSTSTCACKRRAPPEAVEL